MKWKHYKIAILGIVFILKLNCYSQLKGDHLLGDFGLSAGTQAPPSIIAALPVYWYDASKLKNSQGNLITDDLNIDAFLIGAGASLVTNYKVLGGHYGASVLFAFMSNRLEGNKVQSSTSLGLSDMYVQPLQLGWNTKRADFTLGYGIYMPTGKYEFGGSENTGMGMWTNEFSAGTTIYLDKKKTFNFSSIVFFEIHSKKKGTEVKTGDIVSVSGGLAKTFYKKINDFPVPIIFNAGPIYYMQFKVSDDKIPVGNTVFTGSKDKIYALGLEFNALHPKLKTSLGFRWLNEFGTVNRFEGNTFLLTAGYIIESLQKDK